MISSASRARTVLSCLAFLACGDDAESGVADSVADTQAPDATVADSQVADTAPADTQVADSAPADTAPADTAIVAPSFSVQFVQELDGPGVPEVAVAWTPPGGSRIETTTDANGRIAFYDVDWTKGLALLVGRKDNYVVRGVLFGEEDLDDPSVIRNAEGDVLIVTSPTAQPTRIAINGTATGVASGAYLFVAAALPDSPQSVGQGPRFELNVPPATPFEWSAFSWAWDGETTGRNIGNIIGNWAAGSSPGGADDFTMDIDLAGMSMAVKTVSGTFPLFSSDVSNLDEIGIARVGVLAKDGMGLIGSVPRSAIAEDNLSASYDLEWIEPEWATNPVVTFSLSTNSEFTLMSVPGWPTAGPQAVSLPVPPTWSSASGARTIDAPLTWTVGDPTGWVNLFLLVGPSGPNERVGAVFNLPRGTTTFTIPELPGGWDFFEDGEVGVLGASLTTCTPAVPAFIPNWCVKFASSKRTPIGRATP